MVARVLLALFAGCLVLAESSKNIRARASEISDRSDCLKTIISNNGDTTKFSFQVNHPAVKITQCQRQSGETESWTIEPLSSEDTVQGLNINGDSTLKCEGQDSTNSSSDWEKKFDLLVESVTNMQKKLEELILSSKVVEGYQKIGNLTGKYKMHRVGLTWTQAKSKCEQEGAHLLVINNAEETKVVPALFSRISNIQCAEWSDWAWIGVHDNISEGEFWTVLGERLEKLGYSYWVVGRPVLNSNENCVSVNTKGAMYDSECGKTAPYICEI